MKNTLSFLVLSLVLVACGGGGNDASDAQAQAECVPVPGIINVAIFGDSTTLGVTIEPDGSGGWRYAYAADKPAMLLQADLDVRLGKGVAKVIDRAGLVINQLAAL